jgi:hypothetical protein
MAYKPGTEPGANRELGLQGVPGESGGSMAGGDDMPVVRTPLSGTGGLY